MPETTPDKPKAAICPSLCAKAAACALAISGAVFLSVFLVSNFPAKTAGWQASLPTPAMPAAEAEGAFLRAKYQHEAAVRPALIHAGFFSAADLADNRDRHRYHGDGEPSSETLTQALWTMRAFPELHETFLTMLLDGESEPKARAAEFFRYAGFLAAAAEAIADENDGNYRSNRYRGGYDNTERFAGWFAYFRNDPRLKAVDADEGRYSHDREQDGDPAKAGAVYDEKLALAKRVLPVILAGAQREMAAQEELARQEQEKGKSKNRADRAWGDRHSPEDYLEELSGSVNDAVLAMWKESGNPGFFALAADLINAEEGTFAQRLEAVPLIAEKPGLPVSEYLFWQRYKEDLASVTSCVGTNPSSYAYLLGCMDKLMTETTNQMKARGSFILGGQTGPGVAMARVEAFTPARNLSGSLYLLADMGLAMKDAPEYDLDRAYPIFRGMLYRYMKNQPLVLPLNPQNPKDAAVIAWYAEKGWQAGRTLLFSAAGNAADVARHWGSVHLLWWPDSRKKTDADPDLAYLHPVSGHFMTGMLPQLKGKGVSRFLGPITGLWFGRRNVDKTGWIDEKYEARPEVLPAPMASSRAPLRSPLLDWVAGAEAEKAEAAPAHSEQTATIILSREIRQATGDVYRHNYRVNLARQIDRKFKDESMPPLAVFSFTDNAVTMLNEWGLSRGKEVAQATEYLWRFRNDPVIEKRIRDILADTKLSPYERMRKVRRALGLPEKKDG